MHSTRSSSLVRCLPVLAFVWLTGVPAQAGAQAPWLPFQSKPARISAEVPSAPVPSTTTTDSFIGDVTNDIYVSKDGTQRMTIDYSEIPRFALDFAGPDTIYEHAKGALLKQTWSKAISFTDVTVDGRPGKRLVYDTPPVPGQPKHYGEAHFYLVDNRFYVIDALVPAGDTEKDAKRFLGSIRFH